MNAEQRPPRKRYEDPAAAALRSGVRALRRLLTRQRAAHPAAKRRGPRDAIPLRAGLPPALADTQPVSAIAVTAALLLAAIYFIDLPLLAHSQTLPAEARAFMHLVTDLGLGGWKVLLAGAIGGWFLWKARSATRLRDVMRARHRAGLAFFVLAAVAITGVTASALKHAIGRARPSVMEAEGLLVLVPFDMRASFASFPSGHTATIFAAAIALAMIFPRLRAAFFALAVWVALSRVLLGAHWFSDAAASVALAAVMVWAMRRWAAARRWGFVWRGGRYHARLPFGQPMGQPMQRPTPPDRPDHPEP